jgi:hypothetical protein
MYEGETLSRNCRSNNYIRSEKEIILEKRRKITPKYDPIRERLEQVIFSIDRALEL